MIVNLKDMWGINAVVRDFTWKISRERQRHLEMMAAAFLKETKIPPRHVELVQRTEGDKVIFYYRRRG
jgi:hypothetical protein